MWNVPNRLTKVPFSVFQLIVRCCTSLQTLSHPVVWWSTIIESNPSPQIQGSHTRSCLSNADDVGLPVLLPRQLMSKRPNLSYLQCANDAFTTVLYHNGYGLTAQTHHDMWHGSELAPFLASICCTHSRNRVFPVKRTLVDKFDKWYMQCARLPVSSRTAEYNCNTEYYKPMMWFIGAWDILRPQNQLET